MNERVLANRGATMRRPAWRGMTRGITFLVSLFVLAIANVTDAQPANADAAGCTAAPGGYVCNETYGTAAYVDRVRAVRGKANLICNWQAAMYVNDSAGRRLETRWSPVQDRCDTGRAWYDFWPRKIYPNNSRVCVSWYESGVKQGGSPCITLRL
jgi:hypothetical protein